MNRKRSKLEQPDYRVYGFAGHAPGLLGVFLPVEVHGGKIFAPVKSQLPVAA